MKVKAGVLVYPCPGPVGALYRKEEGPLIQIHSPSSKIGPRMLMSLGQEMAHLLTGLKGSWAERYGRRTGRAFGPSLRERNRYGFDEAVCYLLAPLGAAAFAVLRFAGRAEWKTIALKKEDGA
jgi:hypothetical protein